MSTSGALCTWRRFAPWSRWAILVTAACGLRSPVVCRGLELDYPLAIAADSEGAVFLADRNLPGIWKISDGSLDLYYQADKKFRTPLNAPRSLAIDKEGRLLAGDSATREVYRFNAEGKPEPLTMGGIGNPMGIAVNQAGELLVSDLELHCIWKVPSAGGKPARFVEIPAPRGISIDARDRLWVVSHGKDQLLRVLPDGKVEVVVKGRPFQFPHAVVVDEGHQAYVCDGYADAVWKVDSSGKPARWAEAKRLVNPVGLAWRGEALLVVDPHAKGVFQIDPRGRVTPWQVGPAGE